MKKILIVDDEEGQRDMLRAVLRKAGYQTDAACSGEEAVEKAGARDFDVFLIDMIMPGKNGIDIMPEIKRLRPRAKMIIITGFPSVETAVEAVRKGASDYIPKPYRSKDILVTIRRVLEEARFEENLKKLEFDQALVSLSNSIRRRIIILLRSGGDMRLKEITEGLGMEDHTKVLFHLKMLRDSGLVEHDEKDYSLTKQGKRAIECLNILEYYFEDR